MIVQNFKKSGESLDMKQKDITKLFHVHFFTVSAWGTEKDTISLERLVKYANHFSFSLDYIFGLTNYNDESYLPLSIDLHVIAQNLKGIRKKTILHKTLLQKRLIQHKPLMLTMKIQ